MDDWLLLMWFALQPLGLNGRDLYVYEARLKSTACTREDAGHSVPADLLCMLGFACLPTSGQTHLALVRMPALLRRCKRLLSC